MHNHTSKIKLALSDTLPIILIITFILYITLVYGFKIDTKDNHINLNNGWTTDDETTYKLTNLPENTTHITMELRPIFSETAPIILDAYLDNGEEYINRIYRNGILHFIICVIIMSFGIFAIYMGTKLQKKNAKRNAKFLFPGHIFRLTGGMVSL